MKTNTPKETGCCPIFDTKPYDGVTHIWKDKLFIKDNVNQIFHIPLNMGRVITRMWSKIESTKSQVPTKDFLMLAYDPSPWTSEIYLTAKKEITGAQNVRLSGTFISKVFDGPYNAVPKWIKEMDAYLKDQNKTAKKYYFYYTTCPKCAKAYGHNYTVAFAQV